MLFMIDEKFNSQESSKSGLILWSSVTLHIYLYIGTLQIKAHPSVAAHMLSDLEDVTRTSSTEATLLLIDIAGYAVYIL